MIENHVARAMRSRLGLDGEGKLELPLLDDAQLRKLEAAFPPRCLQPNETVEAHLRYASNVSLVEALRHRYAEHQSRTVEDSDLADDDLPSTAERAR